MNDDGIHRADVVGPPKAYNDSDRRTSAARRSQGLVVLKAEDNNAYY